MRPIPLTPALVPGLVLLVTSLSAGAAQAGDLRNFEDAAVRAVQFVDASEGWAVGDEGVIWHTIDGGRNWERQPSGVRGSLRSLHFLNPYTGWVAGREELPNGGGSSGVLLYTRDGGVRWQRVLLNALPGLNRVCFADDRTGYLVGDGADQFPTGVFVTTNAGRTWQPLPGPRCPAWLAADFDQKGGALAGAWNRLATVRGGRVSAINMDTLGGRNLRGLQLRGDGGVAVGQGGLVLVSTGTGGSTWDYADLKLPRGAQAGWDFHAVHGVGQHVWAVGRPGSVALHSPDLGGHWEVVRTGQPLPLHGLFFRDEQHGWAVGELGTILATADGGKSWQVQRRGGQQAAVLFVHARAAGTPLDTVALVGGADGYLAAALRVTAPDPATAGASRAEEGDRFCDAVRQAGGAAGEMLWQFPLPTHLTGAGSQDLLRAWDVLHGGQAAQHLLGQLVLALRTWRPAVVVTDPPDGGAAGRAEDALLAEALAEAFRRAADPQAFPEQLGVLGLEPWQASKLYARWEGPQDTPVTLDLTAISARLGTTAREFATGPSTLLQEGPVRLPAERRYRLLADRLEGAANHHELMQGLNLVPGGPARRAAVAVEEPTPEQVKALRQQANLRALAEASPGGLTNPDRLLAQVGPMLEDLPDDQAAPAAHAVAMQYARLGQWELARELFLLLVERYPTHPLAADACRWLIYHSSSSEARRRHELGQFMVVGQLQVGLPHERARPREVPARPTEPLPKGFEKPKKSGPSKAHEPGPSKAHEPPDIPEFTAQAEGQLMHLSSQEQTRKWYQGSLDLEPRLAGFGPLLATDPAVQFCLQAARRNLGDFDTAQQWYRQFVARQPDGPWRRAAAAELWLLKRSGPCPKPVMVCRHTDTRPFLDGKLDDPCWQGGSALKLTSAAGDTVASYPTDVRLAYDRDYLYLAVRCGRPAGKQVPRARVRTRDQDLRGHDRVSLLLDLDRDYATCFHLQVDERGCVAEDCWGDKTWDPRWFVAVHSGPQEWVVEAAIPLVALTGDIVTSGRAWAANVVRVLPGRGVQALSLPAEAPEEALRPEGMGLLLFAQDPTQPVAERPEPATSRAP